MGSGRDRNFLFLCCICNMSGGTGIFVTCISETDGKTGKRGRGDGKKWERTFTKNEKKNKKVDINAVDGISLTVREGEIVGILGPNGAGKTTLLRMMSRLMRPTSGMVSIRVGDMEITDDIEIKRHIGYLSNNTKLYGRLSSRELLQMLGALCMTHRFIFLTSRRWGWIF